MDRMKKIKNQTIEFYLGQYVTGTCTLHTVLATYHTHTLFFFVKLFYIFISFINFFKYEVAEANTYIFIIYTYMQACLLETGIKFFYLT